MLETKNCECWSYSDGFLWDIVEMEEAQPDKPDEKRVNVYGVPRYRLEELIEGGPAFTLGED